MDKAAPLYEIINDTVNWADNDLSVELRCEIAEVSKPECFYWVSTIPDRQS